MDQPRLGIGRGACVERAIIDRNACIGKGVVIRSHEDEADRDEMSYSIREGIVVIPKGAIIPDNTVI